MDLFEDHDNFIGAIIKGAKFQNKMVGKIQEKIDAKKAAKGKVGNQTFQKILMPWKVIGGKKRKAAAKAALATKAAEQTVVDTKAADIKAVNNLAKSEPESWFDIFNIFN